MLKTLFDEDRMVITRKKTLALAGVFLVSTSTVVKCFKKAAHASGVDEAVERGLGSRLGEKRLGMDEEIVAKEEGREVGEFGLTAEQVSDPGEVDVGREVGLARLVEDADRLVGVEGLEGVSALRREAGVAVVYQQSRALVGLKVGFEVA